MARKTWVEKLNNNKKAEVKTCPKNIAGMKQGQIMLVPTARQFDDFIRGIPMGRAMSVQRVRAALAAANGAEVTCPITSGFHLRTVAEVANERLEAGYQPGDVTPIWRVLDEKSPVLARLDGGSTRFLALRREEGL
ncbi:MAG: hypothetical protein AAFY56_09250 [Pseudomonadota bacterium]